MLKDHYRTLGVQPSATADDVKKAYRLLAHKYHPDKNGNSEFAAIHFREIKEAYEVLGDVKKRLRYDEERWLSGMSNRTRDKQAIITPLWILNETEKLKKHMAAVDIYRMSHSALRDYILLLLSDVHIAVLQKESAENGSIISNLLQATRNLKYPYIENVAERLNFITMGDETLLNSIHERRQTVRKQSEWERLIPIIAIVATLMICLLMYLYNRG